MLIRISFLFLFFIIAAGEINSQKDSTLSEKLTREFCDEFSKKDFTSFSNAKIELGLLIIPLITKHSVEIKKEWSLNSDNVEDYEKIAEKIGEEAALGCPEFRQFVKNNLSQIVADDDENTRTLTGTLLKIEDQQFSCLVVKTKSGKEEKLWWFGFFEGADELIKSKGNFLNKSVYVEYGEMEVYDSRLKDYHAIKVVKKIQKN
jgi:hypothetical protein